jgi:hypothetical protein
MKMNMLDVVIEFVQIIVLQQEIIHVTCPHITVDITVFVSLDILDCIQMDLVYPKKTAQEHLLMNI